MEQEAAKERHLLAFQLGSEEYAVPVDQVESIIKPTSITPVPGSTDRVRGIMNLRGRVISVLDLRACLGMEPDDDVPQPKILVVKIGSVTVGVTVDNVSEVFTLEAASLSAPPWEIRGAGASAIDGVIQIDDRLIASIDLSAVVNTAKEELEPADRISA